MALKNYNPVTPSQRQLVLVDRSAFYKGKPVKALTEGKLDRRPQQQRPHHGAFPRRRAQEVLPHHRLQAPQVRWPAKVERIEYDPNRTAFIALMKYHDGELAYILAPQRLAVGDIVVAGEHVDVKPGNAMPLGEHAGRHHRAQHRDQDRQGRADRALRRHLCPDRRPRPGIRHPAAEFGRAAPRAGRCMATVGAVSNPDHMNIRSARRAASVDGPPSAQSRRRHEPDRSPARRRRRPHLGRPPSGHPVGLPDQGQEDPQEQVDHEIHHPSRHARKKK